MRARTEAGRPRQTRREAGRPRQTRREAGRPRQARREAGRPRQTRREAGRPRQARRGRRWTLALLLAALWVVGPGPARGDDFGWQGRVEALEAALESDAVTDRVDAARALGGLPPSQADAALRRALADRSEAVQLAAIEATAQAGAREVAREVLPKLLDAGSEEARAAAARALGALGVRQAAPALLVALADPRSSVRRAVVEALGALRDPTTIAALTSALSDASREVVVAALDELGAFGDQNSVYAVLDKTRSPEVAVRRAAVQTLGEMGDRRATMALLKIARDDQAEVALAAVRALGEIRDPRAVGPLLTMLEPGAARPLMTLNIIQELGAIGDPAAVAPLLELLEQAPHMGPVIVSAIARVGAPALPALKRALAMSLEPERTRLILRALAQIPGEGTALELVAALRDSERYGRDAVLEAIGAFIAGRDARGVDAADGLPSPEVIEALALSLEAFTPGDRAEEASLAEVLRRFAPLADARLTEPLLARYPQASEGLRVAILDTLRVIDRPEAAELIARELSSEQPAVVEAAIYAAARVGDARAVAPLARLMEDGAPAQRKLAATALGQLGAPQAVDALLAAADDDEHPERRAAMWALSLAGRRGEAGEARAFALEVLEDLSHPLAYAALDVLATTGGPQRVATLKRAFAEGRIGLQYKALEVAGSLGDAAMTPEVAQGLGSRYEVVRAEAAWAAGQLGAASLMPVLVERLYDPSTRVAINAAASLATLAEGAEALAAGEEASAALRGRLHAMSPQLRSNALLALDRLDPEAVDLWTLDRMLTQAADVHLRETLYRVALSRAPGDEAVASWLDAALARERDPQTRRVIARLRDDQAPPAEGLDDWYVIELPGSDGLGQATVGMPVHLYLPDGRYKATFSDENGKVRLDLAEPGLVRAVYPRPVEHTEAW